MIGKTISHYRILEKLGAGGMGTVYKAQDIKLDRFVALKFLPHHLSQDEENKKRFIHEAKAASALNHPNIATIYEIDEAEGQLFIAMEYVEGQSLQQLTIDNGQLTIANCLNYAIQIAEGLAKAHSKGIIHRDIKPANILVTEDGHVKIVDFGLAKLAGATVITKEGTTLGTVAYMSPEQAQGAKVDHRTDIWSLGVVLYEMVTGQLPFRGDYEQAVVYSIINEEPEPPTAVRSGVPMELERIMLKALAKAPEERYQHLDEMRVDLLAVQKKLAREAGVTAAVSAPVKHGPTQESRPPRRALFVGGAVLAVAVIFVLTWLAKTRWQQPAFPAKSVSKKLAVLPFVNLTGDAEQEYFCDGMTEQLITNLSRMPELKVIARTSVMRYKNTEKDIRQISKELDVQYVLEGSVRKGDDRLRITAQLIEAREGTHLWAEDYDRRLADVFAIQDDVSQSIASALEVTFSGTAKAMVRSSYSTSFEAFDAHLKTRYFIDNVYTKTLKEEDFQRGLEMAQRTVALDPNHYLGYFDLAALHEIHWGFTGAPEDTAQSRKYAYQAYRLNPDIPETNAAMAYMLFRRGKTDSAFAYMKKALALHPNTWEPWHILGANLSNLGLYRQAIQFYDRAVELNPFFLHTRNNRGWMLLLVGEVSRALQDFTRAYQIQPDYVPTLTGYSMALLVKGKYQQADSLLRRGEGLPLGANNSWLKFVRALYFARLGEKEKALALSRWPGVLATLGMKKEALQAIADGIENKRNGYQFLRYLPLRHLPFYDNLRDEPEFQRLLDMQQREYEKWLQKYSEIAAA